MIIIFLDVIIMFIFTIINKNVNFIVNNLSILSYPFFKHLFINILFLIYIDIVKNTVLRKKLYILYAF